MTERAKFDMLGIHFAVRIFISTTILGLLLRSWADTSPIWAISSMIAVSDPRVDQAVATFRGRITNALLGCTIGLLVLLIGGSTAWKLPIALALAVLLSSYVVRMQVMWRQAPITAAIVIAGGLAHQSKLSGAEAGARRVLEVLLGCLVGFLVTWTMSKVWAPPPSPPAGKV